MINRINCELLCYINFIKNKKKSQNFYDFKIQFQNPFNLNFEDINDKQVIQNKKL